MWFVIIADLEKKVYIVRDSDVKSIVVANNQTHEFYMENYEIVGFLQGGSGSIAEAIQMAERAYERECF